MEWIHIEVSRLGGCIAALKAKVPQKHFMNCRGCHRNHYATALSYIQLLDIQLPRTANIMLSDGVKLPEEMSARLGREEFRTLNAA
jgi:hypothetical protein